MLLETPRSEACYNLNGDRFDISKSCIQAMVRQDLVCRCIWVIRGSVTESRGPAFSCCRDAPEGDVIEFSPSAGGIPYRRSLMVPLRGGSRRESNAGELNRKMF